MPRTEITLEPVTRLTADAIGKPGKRTFYLQAADEKQTITLGIEKIQLQSLVVGIGRFLDEVAERFPAMATAQVTPDENAMRLQLPLEVLFHAGDLGLAYDSERDWACLIAKEQEFQELKEGEEKLGDIVRMWCTRSQLRALSAWGSAVVAAGRPICPQCQQPMEPEGHFCPKKNGHKKPAALRN